LLATLEKTGITGVAVYHANDSIEELTSAFEKAWDADIIISCGAVSMGDADHIPEVLSGLGAQCLFHKVAIKPGKPVWCGVRQNNKIIFALPGNPFSTRVNTRLFIQPFIKACLGQVDTVYHFEFEGKRIKKSSLDELFPAQLNSSGKVEAIPFNGSGDIRAGVNASGIALHPAQKAQISTGEMVKFLFF
jgi:molybdopterin molybdotransferase